MTISNTVTLTNAVCTGGCGVQGDTCNTASNILTVNDVTTCDTCVASGVEEVKMVIECPGATASDPTTFTQINYMKADSCSCAQNSKKTSIQANDSENGYKQVLNMLKSIN